MPQFPCPVDQLFNTVGSFSWHFSLLQAADALESQESSWNGHLPHMLNTGTQMPCLPLRPYKDAQERTRREMRSEVIETIKATALKFVHNVSEHLAEFIGDIVRSKGWRQLFGTACTAQPPACEKNFVHKLGISSAQNTKRITT